MKTCLLLLLSLFTLSVQSQDTSILLKEADNFEKQLKEPEALEKYKQVLVQDTACGKALVKAAELNVAIGGRQPDKNAKKLYYESALAFAQRAYQADSTHADANYAMAMASGRMTDVEAENKKIVAFIKDVKRYADKALSIDPNHGKANYVFGKWHYEMANLSGIKKIAVKLFYGGLPEADMEKAIQYMEKCKSLEPYFVRNYLDLAKAYKDIHQPSRAIEILSRLVKLPIRTADDPALKAEGARLLESLQ